MQKRIVHVFTCIINCNVVCTRKRIFVQFHIFNQKGFAKIFICLCVSAGDVFYFCTETL